MSLLSERALAPGPRPPAALQAITRHWPDSRYRWPRDANVIEARALIIAGVNPAHIYDESLPDDWLHEGSWLDPATHNGTTVSYARHGLTQLERRDVALDQAISVECYDVDNECRHGSLPSDRKIACSCWDVPRLHERPARLREAA